MAELSPQSTRRAAVPVVGLRRPGAETLQAAAGYGVPFFLVLYLGLMGGGYDEVVRSEIGIASWWIVLLGTIVGVLPTTRVTPRAWIALAGLAAFALWTGLAISWSESSERSAIELARVASLLGVFALATLVQGRASVRRTVAGVGAAIALLGFLALLSRIQPGWLPGDTTGADGTNRLSYPLNYWNGLATLLAIGIPLLLTLAVQSRRVLTSSAAAAVIPALALAAFYTFSRGGAGELVIGLVILFALHPQRVSLVAPTVITGFGSALLVIAATQRDALESDPLSSAATSQGEEMFALAIVVSVGVGLVQAALALAARHGIGPRVQIDRRRAGTTTAVVAVIALVVAIAAGAPGELSDRWNEFKAAPEPSATDASRFESSGGGGRYQLWSAAIEANKTEPVLGIGPGTFEYWEARAGTTSSFVRDAHSLYLEVLAELGIVGLVLIVGFLLFVLVTGVARAIRGSNLERRGYVATATAGCVVFAISAAIDWVWEMTVLAAVMLLLAAAVLGPSAEPQYAAGSRFRRALMPRHRPLLAVLGLIGIATVVAPLAGASSVRGSQEDFASGQLGSALQEADRAGEIQPYAASPELQRALVLERQGSLSAAAIAAEEATRSEATNWRTWLILSRIEARRGRVEESIAAYERSKELNPLSPLFSNE